MFSSPQVPVQIFKYTKTILSYSLSPHKAESVVNWMASMKIQVLEQKRNPLLKRDEVLISLEHPGKATPSRKEILPELAKALKSGEDLLIIDRIFSLPGKNLSKARVLSYGKREEIPREKLEKMKARMRPRKAPAEGEGKEEEAPTEEKPKEKAPAGKRKPESETPREEGKEEAEKSKEKRDSPEGERKGE